MARVVLPIAWAVSIDLALGAAFQTLRTGPLPAPRAFAALFQIIVDVLRVYIICVWTLADRATAGKVLLLLPRRPVLEEAKIVV